MTIIGSTSETKEVVDRFALEHGAEYPIFCRSGAGVYSTGGIPSAYIIGPDGTVLWQGHPNSLQDSELEEWLKDVEKENRVSTWAFQLKNQMPPLPAKLSSVMKLLEKMKFGAALKKIDQGLARMEGEELEQATAAREWVAKAAVEGLETAARQVRDGDVYKGYLTYLSIEERYKGHEYAKQAKDLAKALEKGDETKLEVKAGEMLAEAKLAMMEERKPEDQLACLKRVLASKYEETKAGKEAAEIARELESKIQD